MLSWYYKRKAQAIDKFQYQNLINNLVRFKKIDLQETPLLKALTETLREEDKSTPIVVVDKRPGRAAKLAYKLEKRGFINAYYLAKE